jgi:Tol biopolymer transport system component
MDPIKVAWKNRRKCQPRGRLFTGSSQQGLFEKRRYFLLDISSGEIRQITRTIEQETNPVFAADETNIIYRKGQQSFQLG